MSECRSCGAPIVWAIMDSGKKMPLDATPEKRIVLDGDDVGYVEDTYGSHFATCPTADQHRKAV